MYGWRGKIGIIIPSANATMEPECNRMAPDGVAVLFSRMLAIGCSMDDLKKQDAFVEQCSEELATAGPDLIIFGCTSGSFFEGAEWEREIVRRIEATSRCPAITTSGAVLGALAVTRKRRISILSPYVDAVARLESAYFANCGYDVVSERNLGYSLGKDIYSTTPEQVYRHAKETVTKDTELLFISCTNLRTIEIVPLLEKDLGIPVVSSNLCSLWAGLRALGIREKADAFGSLLQQY